jgi:hypothetical protein
MGKGKLVMQSTSVGLLLFDLEREPGKRRNPFIITQEGPQ